MTARPLVLNFLYSTNDQEEFGKLFRNIILEKEDLVYPEDLDKDPTLVEKIVGGYVSSSYMSSDPQPQYFLDKLPNLKTVIFLGIGVNWISLEWAKKKGLRIGHTGTEVCADTADIAIIHMAVTARKFLQNDQEGFGKLFLDLILEKEDLVYLEDLDQDPTLVEKIVGCYVSSVCMPSDPPLQDFLDKLPNLKTVSFLGIGVNRISLEWAKKKGLRIGHTGTEVCADTADIAIIHMAVTARKFLQSVSEGMGKEHTEMFPWHLQGHSLSGSTVGIIGMGNIGYKVAVRSYAFDMKIAYHQRNRRSEAEEKAVGAKFFPNLMDMLPECDYVIITCSLTPQTHGLFGREQFRVMKKSATLVNVARGKIVDQEALYDVLKNKEIHAAALDVTDPDPLPRDHPLLSLPNIIITPHCGTNTFEARRAMIVQAFENMECALQGKPMPNEVLLE